MEFKSRVMHFVASGKPTGEQAWIGHFERGTSQTLSDSLRRSLYRLIRHFQPVAL